MPCIPCIHKRIKMSVNTITNQREITPKINKTELWFLCMTHRIIMLYNCMKFHSNSLNGFQLTAQTQNRTANDQREITPKINKAELWFSCLRHSLFVLYKCVKFHLNSCNDFQLTKRTGNSIAKDQREITPKICKAELWFLQITHCLIVLYNCMKFHSNSFNSFQPTEWTQNCIY